MNVPFRVFLVALLLAVVNAKSAKTMSAKTMSAKKTSKKGQKPTLHAKTTNTNQCVMTVLGIAQNIEDCFVNPQVGCCQQVVQADSEGCFCNPSMQVLFGPDLIVTTLQNTLLPQCIAVIPVKDVKCKELRNYNYGWTWPSMPLD
jgi:hypothetical protein